MFTDSRRFLSFTIHEYFIRILYNYLGKLVENREYPCDLEILKNKGFDGTTGKE